MASQTATSSSHNYGGAGVGGGEPLGGRQRGDGGLHLVEGPFEIDGGGAGLMERGVGGGQVRVARVVAERKADSVGGGGADERRAADGHVADGLGAFGHGAQSERAELVREEALVDDADGTGRVVSVAPDGAPPFALVVHFGETIAGFTDGGKEGSECMRLEDP